MKPRDRIALRASLSHFISVFKTNTSKELKHIQSDFF
jgi:hypothetical protein